MNSKGALVLLFLAFSLITDAGENHFLIDISTGAGLGWWVYNKGTTTGDTKNNLGWDHTHLSGFTTYEVVLLYQRKHWKIGPGAAYATLFDNVMLASDHSTFHTHKYSIASRFVKFSLVFLRAEYDLFTSRKYVLAPSLKLGSFSIVTDHPKADNFGFRLFWEACFNNEVKLKKGFAFLISPKYSSLTIWPKKEKAQKERHHIYDFGLNIGARYQIK